MVVTAVLELTSFELMLPESFSLCSISDRCCSSGTCWCFAASCCLSIMRWVTSNNVP